MRYMIIIKTTKDELEDFGPADAVERFRELGMSGAEKLS